MPTYPLGSCLVAGSIKSSKPLLGDFPGGPAVRNPASSAGNTGPLPGLGTKIPHATG